MRAAFLDRLRVHRIIETESDPSAPTPSWLADALAAMTPEEVANILWLEMQGDLKQGIRDAKAQLAIEGHFDVKPERALRYLADHIMDFSQDLVDNERAGLHALVKDSVEHGSGAAKLKRQITGFFASGIHYMDDDGRTVERTLNLDSWAESVARTELSRAYNQGSRSLYEEAGITERVWIAAGDSHECPACEATDGEVAKIGHAFEPAGVEDPPLHPRCYCVTMASPEQVEKYRSPEARSRRAGILKHNRAFSAAHGGRMG
jgi:SPP1 gp7 family putative phage head morphogenesis protein